MIPNLPVVSVIIPTYQREQLLRVTLQSIQEPDGFDYEIIVIDDGSSNPNVIAQVVASSGHANCSYYYQENSGAPSARNLGFKKTKGQLIKFLDSDDELYPGILKAQASGLDDVDGPAVCYSDWEFVGNTQDPRTGGSLVRVMDELSKPLEALLDDWWCANFSYLYNRDALEGIEWDETLSCGQDFDFILKVAEKKPRFIYKKMMAGGYRLGDHGQITLEKSHKNLESRFAILINALDRFNENNLLTGRVPALLCARVYDVGREFYKLDDFDSFMKCVAFIDELKPGFVPDHVSNAQRRLVQFFGIEKSEKVMELRRWFISRATKSTN